MNQKPINALEIRGWVRLTSTVDAWIGGDFFLSLQNLLRGQIGCSLLCEYFGIGPRKLEDWIAKSALRTSRTKVSKDFYRINDHVVRCTWNEVEVSISEGNLSKTTAGRDILLEEDGSEAGGTCSEGCLGWWQHSME
jgi:hypothetical protein